MQVPVVQVTSSLIFEKTASFIERDVSQIVPVQGRPRYAYSVQIMSVTGTLTSVAIDVPWSNDMDNWHTVSGSTTTVSAFPSDTPHSNGGATDPLILGEFVRLRYTFSGSLGGKAAIRAYLTLTSN